MKENKSKEQIKFEQWKDEKYCMKADEFVFVFIGIIFLLIILLLIVKIK